MFRLYCEGQEDGLDLGPDIKLWQAFAEMELLEPAMAESYKTLYAIPHLEDEISLEELDEIKEEAESYIEKYGFKLSKHALWVLEQIAGKVSDDSETKKMFGVSVVNPSLKAMWTAPVRKQFGADDIDEIIEAFEDALTEDHEKALIKAYLLALTKRKEDVEEEIGIAIGFDVKSPMAIKYARDQAGDLITGINETTKDRIREVLADGINEGKSMRDLADDIGDVFEVAKGPRAMSIARTETAEAMTWAAEESYKVAGVEKKEWLLAPDYDPAEDDGHCEEYDGEIVDIGEQFHDGVDGPPLHIQCLPGDAYVSPCGRISATSERRYEGNLIRFVTASGKNLRLTPNHPILTLSGWKAAKFLKVGDYVLRIERGAKNKDRPAHIEEIARSFGISEVMMPVASPDFHGDGINGEIAIIRSNGQLRYGLEWRQDGSNLHFFVRNIGQPELARDGHFSLGSHRLLSTPRSRISSSRLGTPLREIHPRPFDSFLFGGATEFDSMMLEVGLDGPAPDAVMLAQRKYGFAGEILFDKVVSVDLTPIVDMQVFNLQTESGIYLAESIITHNCRCAIAPILAEEMEGEFGDEEDEKGTRSVRIVYKSKYQTKEARMARASALGAIATPVERNMRNRVVRLFQRQQDATLKRLRRF